MDDELEELRPLAIDLEALLPEFESGFEQTQSYLDLQTGQVVATMEEQSRFVREVLDGLEPETEADDATVSEAVAALDLSDWEAEAVLEAVRIELDGAGRYAAVPGQDSHEGYRDMEAFIDTVEDERFQDLLLRAIDGRGAFRRFKDTLCEEPRERERWFAFEAERQRERMLCWLASIGVRPVGR